MKIYRFYNYAREQHKICTVYSLSRCDFVHVDLPSVPCNDVNVDLLLDLYVAWSPQRRIAGLAVD